MTLFAVLLASSLSIPWWSVPSTAGVLLTIWLIVSNNRAINKSGLSGQPGNGRSIWRGQTARSVAETAANAAIALQARVEQLEAERETNKITIEHLKADNSRLERLVTQASWGEAFMKQMDKNHTEITSALGKLVQAA